MSGGFAVVQPDSQLSINAVEGFPLEEFSIDVGSNRSVLCPLRSANPSPSTQNVRSQIAEAQKIANGSGSEQDIAEAKIELEVRQTPLTRPEHSD